MHCHEQYLHSPDGDVNPAKSAKKKSLLSPSPASWGVQKAAWSFPSFTGGFSWRGAGVAALGSSLAQLPFWETELVIAGEQGRISEELGFHLLS